MLKFACQWKVFLISLHSGLKLLPCKPILVHIFICCFDPENFVNHLIIFYFKFLLFWLKTVTKKSLSHQYKYFAIKYKLMQTYVFHMYCFIFTKLYRAKQHMIIRKRSLASWHLKIKDAPTLSNPVFINNLAFL